MGRNSQTDGSVPAHGKTPAAPGTTGVDSLGKAVRRNLSLGRLASLFRRGAVTWKTRGFEAVCREVAFRWNLATHRAVWRYRADIPLKKELRAQRKAAAAMGEAPLVSVVVPLYNTPLPFLRQMLESLQRQSYGRWELVLVDGSDARHSEVGKTVEGFARKDRRIRYMKLFKNEGISQNTNIGLAESGGEWIVLLDHDDVLQPNALYEVVAAAQRTGADFIYSDEVVLRKDLQQLGEYHFKPNFGPDTLRGCNYITHLCAFRRALLQVSGGGEKAEYDGAQDYDLVLRLTERAKQIVHIPKVLYFWRQHSESTASGIEQKPHALEAGRQAVAAQLQRLAMDGEVEVLRAHPGAYRVRYQVVGNPLVSVLIPSKDHIEDLECCLDSLYRKAGWPNMEVLVLDNNSVDRATESFYEEAEGRYPGLRVCRYPGAFNFAAICNFGATRAKGDHLLFLNNDLEITGDNFVREMLCYSQRPDVGAVGAMLYYPDGTVQHAGLFVGIGGTAGVNHKGHARGDGGDLFRLCTTQNMSAVTGAALMVARTLYEAVGGMDEERFAVAFNDVDFCLRLREQGLWNVFTPFAEGIHYESKSRGYDLEGPARQRFEAEAAALRSRHPGIFAEGDPFYNPHFTLENESYGYA